MGFFRAFFAGEPETGTASLTAPPQLPNGPDPRNVEGWRGEVSGDGSYLTAGRRVNWEVDAWALYESVPEARAAIDWIANGISRIRISPCWAPDDSGDPQPIDSDDEYGPQLIAPMRDMFGGPLQQSVLMREWSLYRMIVGKCIVAGVRLTPQERRQLRVTDEWLWMVRDAAPLTEHGLANNLTLEWRTMYGRVQRTIIVDQGRTTVPPDVIFIPDRSRNPRNGTDTDPITRVLIDVAETVLNTADSVNSVALSRITTTPMIAVSDDISIPGHDDEEDRGLFAWVARVWGARIRNRRKASSRSPAVMKSSRSAEEVPIRDQIMTLDLSSKADERAMEILDRFARRMAIGYGVPVEVVNGSQDQNHWNALYEGQDGARIRLMPEAISMARALDEGYYRWMLYGTVPDEILSRVTLWPDASALVQDPDRSATLMELHRVYPGAVTREELRRACGLPGEINESETIPEAATDAPNPDTIRVPSTPINGGQAGIPSVPGGPPMVRSPGFPAMNGSGRA